MGKVSSYFEQNIPEKTVRRMYSRLSKPDVEALYNDNLNGLSFAGRKEVLAADDFIRSKQEIPKLEAQEKEAQQPTTGFRGAAREIAAQPAAAATGIARGLVNLLNTPSYVAKAITGKEVIPKIPRPESFAQLGGQISGDPPLPESPISEAIGGVLPSIAGGEALAGGRIAEKLGDIAPQTASGALYGASSSPDHPIAGAAIGGGIGAGTSLLGSLVAAPAAKAISQYAIAPLIAKSKLLIDTPTIDDTIASALGKAYRPIRDKADRWSEELAPMAKQADLEDITKAKYDPQQGWQTVTKKFKNDDFKKAADKIISQYEPDAKTMPSIYNDVINSVKLLRDDAPTSYSEATRANKLINSLPSSYSETNQTKTKVARDVARTLRNSLRDQIATNAKNNPAGQQFLDKWNEHLANYRKMNNFNEIPTGATDKYGNLKLEYSPSQAKMMGYYPSENISKSFLPKKGEKSTARMEHFANLIGGDKNTAKSIIKNEVVSPAFKDGVFNPNMMLKKYNDLSINVKKYLFSDNERKILDSASKAKSISKIDSLAPKRIGQLGAIGAGGAGGYFYGEHMGDNPWSTAILGALGGHLAERLMAKSLATPSGIQRISNVVSGERAARRKITYPIIGLAAPLLGGNQ